MQHHNKQQITVLLTAGHAATTALATIEALKKSSDIDWKIAWIGPKQSLAGTRLKPFELELFPKLGVSVYSITAGKLQSKFTRHTIPSLLKIPVGFFASIQLLREIKPQIVLSFGGFAAVPVVVAASIMRIPVVLHEQTIVAGLANKVSGFFANKIALARPESRKFFQRKKCVVVGNPLMAEIVNTKVMPALPKVPLIYVTGGSRGAQRLNTPVFVSLPELLPKFKIVHQTGQLDYEKASALKETLPKEQQKNYEVYSFINPLDVGKTYERASIVIGRAGANTVSEVKALGIPSIFIPIPWTRADEQTKNAQDIEKLGMSRLLPESRLSSKTLIETIEGVVKDWEKMKKASQLEKDKNKDITASTRLVSLLSEVLS